MLWLREQGTTIVFSTHDMHVAEQMCDTILMIFQGKKVLDGSLSSIQQSYPSNRIKVRLANGSPVPDGLPGVQSVEQVDDFWSLSMHQDYLPQTVLGHLAQSTDLQHFEVVRPTLHDIFVDIARPRMHETHESP